MNDRITITEKVVLAIVAIAMMIAFYLLYNNISLFNTYVVEDGIVEWITVLGLLAGSFICFKRVAELYKQRGALFLVITIMFGVILFFGAGEEISWGQRIFGIQSSDYFRQHNTQGETNIHNLVLGGVRLNRWIFSFLLTAVLSVYVFLIPFLYRRKKWMQNLVDKGGIPLPKPYQVWVFLLLFIVSELMKHEKRAEMLEMGTALLLFLIIAFPLNKKSFTVYETKRHTAG